MPELPEVETIRQTLKQLVIGEEIESIQVNWENIIKYPLVEDFKYLLVNQSIQDINRRGKFLKFYFDQHVLVSHLRMEGNYSVHKQDEPYDKHTHIIFNFSSGKSLRYRDVRKFGTMHVFKKGEQNNVKPLNQLGPEPFDEAFTIDYFAERLQKTTRMIKAVLLDQSVVAGLGNIYVDETLFKANIHPMRRARTLSHKEITALRAFAIETLQEAIEQGGTTIRSYIDGHGDMGMFQQKLYVYGQAEEPCQVCSEKVEKIKVSGRGTHICPSCQPL